MRHGVAPPRRHVIELDHLACKAAVEISLRIVLEALHQLDELLDGLPAPVKRAFLLSQLDGLTQQQIALQLNITERTVRRHLTRAAEQCYFADILGAGR